MGKILGVSPEQFFGKEYMKLHEAQENYKNSVKLSPCLVCGGKIDRGYYGRHENGGTCSKKCEETYEAKEKVYVDDQGRQH